MMDSMNGNKRSFPRASTLALGPNQPPVNSSGVKWLGHDDDDDDHSPLSRAEVKEWGYSSTPPYAFRAYVRSNLPYCF